MSITLPPMPVPRTYDATALPLWSEQQLRARDIEVAKAVLKAAENALINASIEDRYAKVRAGITAATVIVRALEIKHE